MIRPRIRVNDIADHGPKFKLGSDNVLINAVRGFGAQILGPAPSPQQYACPIHCSGGSPCQPMMEGEQSVKTNTRKTSRSGDRTRCTAYAVARAPDCYVGNGPIGSLLGMTKFWVSDIAPVHEYNLTLEDEQQLDRYEYPGSQPDFSSMQNARWFNNTITAIPSEPLSSPYTPSTAYPGIPAGEETVLPSILDKQRLAELIADYALDDMWPPNIGIDLKDVETMEETPELKKLQLKGYKPSNLPSIPGLKTIKNVPNAVLVDRVVMQEDITTIKSLYPLNEATNVHLIQAIATELKDMISGRLTGQLKV